jgi:hypothetical protein
VQQAAVVPSQSLIRLPKSRSPSTFHEPLDSFGFIQSGSHFKQSKSHFKNVGLDNLKSVTGQQLCPLNPSYTCQKAVCPLSFMSKITPNLLDHDVIDGPHCKSVWTGPPNLQDRSDRITRIQPLCNRQQLCPLNPSYACQKAVRPLPFMSIITLNLLEQDVIDGPHCISV